jgi:hypothetical protein
MIVELQHLDRDLKAALAAHDAVSNPMKARAKPEVVVSAEALAAVLNLKDLAF